MTRLVLVALLATVVASCDRSPTGPGRCSRPEDFTRYPAPITLPDGTPTGDTLWLSICYTRGRVR